MLNESRLSRFSEKIQSLGLFGETHLVGTVGAGLARDEKLSGGRRIVRLGLSRRSSNPAWKIVSAVVWHGSVVWHYRRQHVRAVAAHSVWTLPACWAIARSTKALLVYNAHELETETPSMTGLKRALARFVERALIHRCDVVSCANGSISEWYADRYGIAPPLPVLNIPEAPRDVVDLKGMVHVGPDGLLFIHTGRIAAGRHVDDILEVFGMDSCSAHVVFLGDGPLRGLVVAAAAESDNIHWLPPVDPEEVVSYVASADVALCLIDVTSRSYQLSSPNKLLEGLAAGIPVVCTDLPEARRLMGRSFESWLVPSPREGLQQFVQGVTPDDVARFKRGWVGLQTRRAELQLLADAYAEALSHRTVQKGPV